MSAEQAYVHWVRRYVIHHGKRHPAELGAAHVSAFLAQPATKQDVAASTQNQALNALVFLYRHVLALPLPELDGLLRAKRPARLPVVFTRREVKAVLAGLHGTHALIGGLPGAGGLGAQPGAAGGGEWDGSWDDSGGKVRHSGCWNPAGSSGTSSNYKGFRHPRRFLL